MAFFGFQLILSKLENIVPNNNNSHHRNQIFQNLFNLNWIFLLCLSIIHSTSAPLKTHTNRCRRWRAAPCEWKTRMKDFSWLYLCISSKFISHTYSNWIHSFPLTNHHINLNARWDQFSNSAVDSTSPAIPSAEASFNSPYHTDSTQPNSNPMSNDSGLVVSINEHFKINI